MMLKSRRLLGCQFLVEFGMPFHEQSNLTRSELSIHLEEFAIAENAELRKNPQEIH